MKDAFAAEPHDVHRLPFSAVWRRDRSSSRVMLTATQLAGTRTRGIRHLNENSADI
jgi:hypothetical protein